jgi:hypothetical protein
MRRWYAPLAVYQFLRDAAINGLCMNCYIPNDGEERRLY